MNLRREARWLWPISAIMVIALVCGAYILTKQRLQSPLEDRYALKLEFDAVDAVTPGLGSPVTVAGVSVGQIDGAELKDGRGVLSVSMDPAKLPEVYADAAASLVPNTPLKDMQIRLFPGRDKASPLKKGATIKVAETTTPTDSDELLRSLDTDNRAFVRGLIADLGLGLKGRKRDLNAVLKSLGPTAVQMRRVTALLAERRKQIPKLVHNLAVIGRSAARSDRELSQVVTAGNATLAALADNGGALGRSLELLPGTLGAARTTLSHTQPFARSLTSSLTALDPALSRLRTTLRDTPDATRGLVPLPAKELSRFIDAVAPLARNVKPAARDLNAARPPLERAFAVLERTTNMIAYSPGADSKSYLFWLAWFAHNANSAVSTQDAYGAVFRGYAVFSCSTLDGGPALAGLLTAILGFNGTCPP